MKSKTAKKPEPASLAFDPASLTKEEQESVIELYLGIHPKYFLYVGTAIHIDVYNAHLEKKPFNGFRPHMKRLGIEI